jgi:hypothetical protein
MEESICFDWVLAHQGHRYLLMRIMKPSMNGPEIKEPRLRLMPWLTISFN